jgi:amidophosphoribosyltransferase
LVASGRSVEDIRRFLEVDSLHYLSLDGLLSCVKMPRDQYCTACFSGDYPVDVTEPVDKYALERVQLKMFR